MFWKIPTYFSASLRWEILQISFLPQLLCRSLFMFRSQSTFCTAIHQKNRTKLYTFLHFQDMKFFSDYYNICILLICHSSEIRGLCLMKWPSETLQNLPYFWNMKTHVVFFIFILCYFIFFPNECPGLCRHRPGHPLLQIQSCSKWKILFGFFYSKNMANFEAFC